MPGIGVVHLVRHANGTAPLARFLQSYRAHPAGVDHELLLILKGFGGGLPAEYTSLLANTPHRKLSLPDRGFDLEPYIKAAAHFEHRYFCFLNSYSRILAPDWLAKLCAAIGGSAAGLAGATGSCETFAALRAPKGWVARRLFPPFPNPHLRTNAFVAARDVLARVALRPLLFKFLALAAESGKEGLTAQVRRQGLHALLVDRHGTALPEERWHLANVFRQSRQEDLLVADNQTDAYAEADAGRRAMLSRLAWGERARPA